MTRSLNARRWIVFGIGIAVVAFVVLFRLWLGAQKRGGQTPAEPFRIAGNFYYVGASDVTAFLITGPEGHVLIDGGYEGMPPLIEASIAQLGFDVRDVKVILNSEPTHDHAGGLAALQKASGAKVWASEASAETLESGGADDSGATFLPYRMMVSVGLLKYPAVHVEHRFKDGDTIRVGPIALTAHITGARAPGCTSWSFRVRDGSRELNVVSACSLELFPGMQLVEPQKYPGITANFERTFRVLRDLPVDIWVTSHARPWSRYRKFVESAKIAHPVDAFIDPDGYRAYIDSGEARFRKLLAEQQRPR